MPKHNAKEKATGPVVDCVLSPLDGRLGFCPVCDPYAMLPMPMEVHRNCPLKKRDTTRAARQRIEREIRDDIGLGTRTVEEVQATLGRCFSPCQFLDRGECGWGDSPPCERFQRWIERLLEGDCPHYKKRPRMGSCAVPSVPCSGSRPGTRREQADAYISMHQYESDISRLIRLLPPGITDVIGVPRSGMLAAARIADAFHAPLSSIAADHTVVELTGGWRLSSLGRPTNGTGGVTLLVDDTVASGRAIRDAMAAVQAAKLGPFIRAAVYAMPRTLNLVDYYAVELPPPHYLAWNFWNSALAETAATDFDGILCEDIPGHLDTDDARYERALAGAPPKHRMLRSEIPLIVTARLEKYRQTTLKWLRSHGMKTRRLVMGPWSNVAERTLEGVLRLKSETYADSQCTLFVESDPQQAKEIAKRTGRRVLCPAAGRAFGP